MSSALDPHIIFGNAIVEHIELARKIQDQQPVLGAIAAAMAEAIRSGGKVLWCGNGGSAADSQHLAAELVGRFRRERRGLASLALTTNTSILTAVGNDYGFEHVFSRQVESLANPGDVLVGVSTSGNSQNVVNALQAARSRRIISVAFTGAGGGQMGKIAEFLFEVPSVDTARIQEMHILAGHMICDWIELDFSTTQQSPVVSKAEL